MENSKSFFEEKNVLSAEGVAFKKKAIEMIFPLIMETKKTGISLSEIMKILVSAMLQLRDPSTFKRFELRHAAKRRKGD